MTPSIGVFGNKEITFAQNRGHNTIAALHGAHFGTSDEPVAARQDGQVGPPFSVLVRVERCSGSKNFKLSLNERPDLGYHFIILARS